MAKKNKGTTFPQGFSPAGTVVYAWLDKPQEPFDGKGEPHYTLTIALDPDDALVKEWAASIKALTKYTTMPWKVDPESGKLNVKFKSLRQVRVVDSAGNPLPQGVWPWRDSEVRVAYTPNEYPGFGGGVNLYLNGCQVLKLVEGGGSNVNFPKVDGGYVSDGVSKTPNEDGSAQEGTDGGPF